MTLKRSLIATVNLAVLVPFCLIATSATAVEDRSLRRWAIVASPELQQAGVSDLLTTELSRLQGLELVEREQIAAALKELKRASLFGSGDVSKRLQLGRLLRADALLLLSLEEHDGKQFLRAVVSDSRYGARLQCESRFYAAQQRAESIKELPSLVEATRRQFASGVRQIIGLTHFVSKNLTHDFDHFQGGYARLLENAVAAAPGVAVLELQEAQAIARELQLTAGDVKDRVMPVFVQGEFEMSRRTAGEPHVRLKVQVTDSRRTLVELNRDNMTFAEVASLLSEDLPRRIVALTHGGAVIPLTPSQQHKALLARAKLFSSLGAWEHSTALVEAALLLQPNDDARLALVRDYRRWLEANCEWEHLQRQRDSLYSMKSFQNLSPQKQEAWMTIRRQNVEIWQSLAWHVEKLVRDRALNSREANWLCQYIIHYAPVLYRPDYSNRQEVRQAWRQFFWTVYPLFHHLDYNLSKGRVRPIVAHEPDRTRPHEGSFSEFVDHPYELWTSDAFATLFRESMRGTVPAQYLGDTAWINRHSRLRIDRDVPPDPRDGREMLDDFRRFLTEVASPDFPPMALVGPTVTSEFVRLASDGIPDRAQIRTLYAQLAQSKDANVQFLGRFGLLELKVVDLGRGPYDTQTKQEILREADDLSKFFDRYKDKRHPDRYSTYFSGAFSSRLFFVRLQFGRQTDPVVKSQQPAERRTAPQERLPRQPRRPANPHHADPVAASRPRLPQLEKPAYVTERVSFERIGRVNRGTRTWVQCTPTMDLLTSLSDVWVMRRPGITESILPRGESVGEVLLAQWDGQNIWIATEKAGLLVVSPEGAVVGRVGAEQGLPPFELGHDVMRSRRSSHQYADMAERLYPMAPGKCLAVGVFGTHQRVWFAMIERDPQGSGEKAYRVKVFFQATQLPSAAKPSKSNGPARGPKAASSPAGSAAEIFDVGRVAAYQRPGPHSTELLLVGRTSEGQSEPRPPLAIDLRSLTVAPYACLPPWLERPQSAGRVKDYFVCPQGQVLSINREGIYLATPPSQGQRRWTSKQLAPMQGNAPCEPMLLAYQGKVYCTCPQWWRIDPGSLQCEQLTTRSHAIVSGPRYAVSAHYGLVTWSYHAAWSTKSLQFFRVLIDPSGPTPDHINRVSRGTSSAEREKAWEARQEIVRNGGQIGYMHRDARHPVPYDSALHVLITASWRGGDDGLAELKNLKPRQYVLYLDHTPLTDAAMKHVAENSEFIALSVAGTKITPEGFKALEGHYRLRELMLEAPRGSEQWAAQVLAILQTVKLPNMGQLSLEGPGFTDDAIKHLVGFKNSPKLMLRDTAISDHALEEVSRQRNGRLRWTKSP